jgi:hypothetical protein
MAGILRAQGVVSTEGVGFRPLDISDEIYNLRPTNTPFLTMLMGLGKTKVDDFQYRMNIQNIDPDYLTIITVNAGASTINVSTGASGDVGYVRPGLTLILTVGTAPLVTGVNYGGGVTAGVGAPNPGDITLTSTAGLVAGQILEFGSTGSEELSNGPTPITRIPDQIMNFVETLRDTWGQSRHVQNTRFYGGPRQRKHRSDAMWEHKRSINRGLILNNGGTFTQNAQTMYKNSGLFASIITNSHSFSGGHVTFEAVRGFLTQDTRFMVSDKPWHLVSRKMYENIELMIKSNTVPTDYQQTATLNIRWYSLAGKKIYLLLEDCLGLESTLQYVSALIDPDSVEIVTTADQESGAKTWMTETVITKAENPNLTDGTLGAIDTDFGLRVDGEARNAIWLNGQDAVIV